MFQQYVEHKRKVNLGLTGVTICDLAYFNPECISLINDHPDIFEIVCRPFAHDSPLLRTNYGFTINVQKGMEIIRKYFKKTNTFYLAPELMKTAQQVTILRDLNVKGVFINKDRYEKEIAACIPDAPYLIKGVMGATMQCIPFNQKEDYVLYLDIIHGYKNAHLWADVLKHKKRDYFFWRDGESCLLLPFGVEYERRLLEAEEKAGIDRLFLSEIDLGGAQDVKENELHSFPYHSLRPWFKDMKLYWFTSRVREVEAQLEQYPNTMQALWMLTINSDIMSSTEKDFPLVNVGDEVFSVKDNDLSWIGIKANRPKKTLMFLRSDRGIEGEDYLAYLDFLLKDKITFKQILSSWKDSEEPHLLKGYARLLQNAAK